MDTETTILPKSRMFLKIALGAVVVIVLLLGTAYILTEMKNVKEVASIPQQKIVVPPPISNIPHILSDEEKRAVEERIRGVVFVPLTKKERIVIEQKKQNVRTDILFTHEETVALEKRITQ